MASVCSNVAANGGHDSGLSSEPAAVSRASRRVLCCHYTPDGRFVLSGSEDTNIRVWKVPQSAGIQMDPSENRQSGDVYLYFCDVSP